VDCLRLDVVNSTVFLDYGTEIELLTTVPKVSRSIFTFQREFFSSDRGV
jgi:hypothetical protein